MFAVNCPALALFMLLGSTDGIGAPKVLFEAADTQPIEAGPARRLDGFVGPKKPTSDTHPNAEQAKNTKKTNDQNPVPAMINQAALAKQLKPMVARALRHFDRLLPVRSDTLALGRFDKRRVDFPTLKAPVCLIGADPRSLDWLTQHRARLQRLGARCLLVDAPDAKALQRALSVAGGLPLLPASGDGMAQRYGLTHYPALLSRHWIEQ